MEAEVLKFDIGQPKEKLNRVTFPFSYLYHLLLELQCTLNPFNARCSNLVLFERFSAILV